MVWPQARQTIQTEEKTEAIVATSEDCNGPSTWRSPWWPTENAWLLCGTDGALSPAEPCWQCVSEDVHPDAGIVSVGSEWVLVNRLAAVKPPCVLSALLVQRDQVEVAAAADSCVPSSRSIPELNPVCKALLDQSIVSTLSDRAAVPHPESITGWRNYLKQIPARMHVPEDVVDVAGPGLMVEQDPAESIGALFGT